jgi:hypothetical protein
MEIKQGLCGWLRESMFSCNLSEVLYEGRVKLSTLGGSKLGCVKCFRSLRLIAGFRLIGFRRISRIAPYKRLRRLSRARDRGLRSWLGRRLRCWS